MCGLQGTNEVLEGTTLDYLASKYRAGKKKNSLRERIIVNKKRTHKAIKFCCYSKL